MPRSRQQPPAKPRRLTDSRRRRLFTGITSMLLAISGLALLAVGLTGLLMPENSSAAVRRQQPVTMTRSPLLSDGTTLFVPRDVGQSAVPSEWGCTLTTTDEVRKLEGAPSGAVGERVADGQALVPALEIGPTSDGDVLRCEGLLFTDRVTAWAMPTSPGVRQLPLAATIAGVGLLGAALAINPRVRGMAVFGR